MKSNRIRFTLYNLLYILLFCYACQDKQVTRECEENQNIEISFSSEFIDIVDAKATKSPAPNAEICISYSTLEERKETNIELDSEGEFSFVPAKSSCGIFDVTIESEYKNASIFYDTIDYMCCDTSMVVCFKRTNNTSIGGGDGNGEDSVGWDCEATSRDSVYFNLSTESGTPIPLFADENSIFFNTLSLYVDDFSDLSKLNVLNNLDSPFYAQTVYPDTPSLPLEIKFLLQTDEAGCYETQFEIVYECPTSDVTHTLVIFLKGEVVGLNGNCTFSVDENKPEVNPSFQFKLDDPLNYGNIVAFENSNVFTADKTLLEQGNYFQLEDIRRFGSAVSLLDDPMDGNENNSTLLVGAASSNLDTPEKLYIGDSFQIMLAVFGLHTGMQCDTFQIDMSLKNSEHKTLDECALLFSLESSVNERSDDPEDEIEIDVDCNALDNAVELKLGTAVKTDTIPIFCSEEEIGFNRFSLDIPLDVNVDLSVIDKWNSKFYVKQDKVNSTAQNPKFEMFIDASEAGFFEDSLLIPTSCNAGDVEKHGFVKVYVETFVEDFEMECPYEYKDVSSGWFTLPDESYIEYYGAVLVGETQKYKARTVFKPTDKMLAPGQYMKVTGVRRYGNSISPYEPTKGAAYYGSSWTLISPVITDSNPIILNQNTPLQFEAFFKPNKDGYCADRFELSVDLYDQHDRLKEQCTVYFQLEGEGCEIVTPRFCLGYDFPYLTDDQEQPEEPGEEPGDDDDDEETDYCGMRKAEVDFSRDGVMFDLKRQSHYSIVKSEPIHIDAVLPHASLEGCNLDYGELNSRIQFYDAFANEDCNSFDYSFKVEPLGKYDDTEFFTTTLGRYTLIEGCPLHPDRETNLGLDDKHHLEHNMLEILFRQPLMDKNKLPNYNVHLGEPYQCKVIVDISNNGEFMAQQEVIVTIHVDITHVAENISWTLKAFSQISDLSANPSNNVYKMDACNSKYSYFGLVHKIKEKHTKEVDLPTQTLSRPNTDHTLFCEVDKPQELLLRQKPKLYVVDSEKNPFTQITTKPIAKYRSTDDFKNNIEKLVQTIYRDEFYSQGEIVGQNHFVLNRSDIDKFWTPSKSSEELNNSLDGIAVEKGEVYIVWDPKITVQELVIDGELYRETCEFGLIYIQSVLDGTEGTTNIANMTINVSYPINILSKQ